MKSRHIILLNLSLLLFTRTLLTGMGPALQTGSLYDSIYMEAEAGLVEAPMGIKDSLSASGGQYVEVEAGYNSTEAPPETGKVRFEVPLDSGRYHIWGRVLTPTGSDDSFWVQVDTGQTYKWNKIGVNPDWTWVQVHDDDNNLEVVSWDLDSGLHTLNIYYREDGAKLDEIYITKYGDVPTKGNLVLPDKKLTLYISHETGNDDNKGSFLLKPLKTLARAYEVARAAREDYNEFELLLKGGETFTDFEPQTNTRLTEYDAIRNTFAFVWDLDRKLTISTYGSEEKALLYGGKYTREGGPTNGIAVLDPSKQEVVIENLHIKRFEVGAMFIFETENVTVRDIRIEEIGTLYFPEEQESPGIYVAGVMYPKNSSNILMERIVMTECHNVRNDVDELHGFYCTRLNHSEIRNCYLKNISGSPLKFRRSQANNVYVHDNEFYYTGVSTQFPYDVVQYGFVRYSGDAGDGCPYAITIENNIFHYPYCWSGEENCNTAQAIKCSISNTGVCGQDACENPERILWINNDFKYQWEPDTTLTGMEEEFSTPGQFQILETFPNPFKDQISLKLHIANETSLSISLMNMHGQVIYMADRRNMVPGEHSIQINLDESSGTADMVPGIYFCRIEAGNLVEYIKLVNTGQ